MPCVSFEWYTDAYGGNTIAAAAWAPLARQALARVDALCAGRVRPLLAAAEPAKAESENETMSRSGAVSAGQGTALSPAELAQAAKNAVCAVAEVLARWQDAAPPPGAASAANDGVSESYAAPAACRAQLSEEIADAAGLFLPPGCPLRFLGVRA
jgi:hypothetical protein